jgi:hypothetical protein
LSRIPCLPAVWEVFTLKHYAESLEPLGFESPSLGIFPRLSMLRALWIESSELAEPRKTKDRKFLAGIGQGNVKVLDDRV